ncbi:hypothetical protein J2Z42_001482 [Clostridium algifaecis]|uniref:Uncharacterized protein n=1 Tax=Clostridium algifaecis TaxID=1472040 RepID=A0ABS4KS12_9CLOT|nr:hypothetical protein [Clostridium algifaecis]
MRIEIYEGLNVVETARANELEPYSYPEFLKACLP